MSFDIAFELLFVVSFLTNIVLLYLSYMFWDDAASARAELRELYRRQDENAWFDEADKRWDDL